MGKIIGYIRVSTKGQIDGNSLEEQTKLILERYPTAEIIVVYRLLIKNWNKELR